MFNDVNQAYEFERKMKKWSKAKKEALINENWDRLKELAECKMKHILVINPKKTQLN